MEPPRRRVLTAIAGVALPAAAGCTQTESSGGGTPTPTIDLEAVVSGPDGERTFFDPGDVASVGEVEKRPGSGAYGFTTQLTEGGTEEARDAFRDVWGGGDDGYRDTTITIFVDGEETDTFGVLPDLAEAIASGEWEGEFLLQFADEQTAETVRDGLDVE